MKRFLQRTLPGQRRGTHKTRGKYENHLPDQGHVCPGHMKNSHDLTSRKQSDYKTAKDSPDLAPENPHKRPRHWERRPASLPGTGPGHSEAPPRAREHRRRRGRGRGERGLVRAGGGADGAATARNVQHGASSPLRPVPGRARAGSGGARAPPGPGQRRAQWPKGGRDPGAPCHMNVQQVTVSLEKEGRSDTGRSPDEPRGQHAE